MKIKCWGARGSIPVSGAEYLKYGGDTTCIEVQSQNGDIVVIDAGSGIRALGNKLASNKKIKHIDMLFTHAHLDHIMGFAFFQPIYIKGMTLTVRGYPYEMRSYRDIIAGIIRTPYFPINLNDKDIRAKITFRKLSDRPFKIGSLNIIPIPLSHPKDGGTGFRIEENGKSFVFLTDNELGVAHNGGLPFSDYVRYCKDVDLLIHDAEYNKYDYKNHKGWGHSLYTDTVKLGIKANVGELGLFHHNNQRTDDQIDKMVSDSKKIVKKANSQMNVFGVSSDYEITL